MEQLEDRIEALREFDRLRREAAHLRDEGCETLLKSLPKASKKKTDADVDDRAGTAPSATSAVNSGAPATLVAKTGSTADASTAREDNADLDAGEWPKFGKGQVLERSEVLKAILACPARYEKKNTKHIRDLTKSLENVKITVALCDEPDHVPVLRAAKALCALAASPDSAFSGSVMYFVYSIVREIYFPRSPDWVVGGAGAGDGLSPNGFVTWQCVRAVSDFQAALRQTAELVTEIAVLVDNSAKYGTFYVNGKVAGKALFESTVQSEWECVDELRMVLSFTTAVNLLRSNIALRLRCLKQLGDGDPETAGRIIAKIRKALIDDLSQHHQRFIEAYGELATFRSTEETLPEQAPSAAALKGKRRLARKRIRETTTPHQIAHQTVRDAGQCARRAEGCFGKDINPKELDELAKEFHRAANSFDALLKTVHAHVTRALDTQLAVASMPGGAFEWDPGEMAFAAAAYVETSEVDSRVRRAANHLLGVMGESGVFPLGNPVRTTQHQYTLHAHNAEIIRAVAAVLEKAHDVPFTPAHAERMLAYFRDGVALKGTVEGTDGSEARSRRVVAAAVLALARVNRMLDERINHDVFRFFSVKRPEDISIPSLRDLFYPDYGLTWVSHRNAVPNVGEAGAGTAAESTQVEPRAGAPTEPASALSGDHRSERAKGEESAEAASLRQSGVYREESIAVLLERMRAHVRHAPRFYKKDPLFSLVLHGPPGTGKTTLVESLAKTCAVPLVEVTPSDIVIGGAEKMEARARAVFTALSLLTRAVILFDEFDPVILRRSPDEKNPSVFSFLTPGMLPKLKTLHERAEERSVAYVLVTNLIAKLDEAAIREGRFDRQMGIYPPDVLSRFGRLIRIAFAHAQARKKEQASLDLIWDVVYKSAGGPMTTLGKPGWFSPLAEGKEPKPGTALDYLFNPKTTRLNDVQKEARLKLPALPPEPWKKLEEYNRRVAGSAAAPRDTSRKCNSDTSNEREDPSIREYKEWAWVAGWDGECPENLQLGGGQRACRDALEQIRDKIPPAADLDRCFRDALRERLKMNGDDQSSSGAGASPGHLIAAELRDDGIMWLELNIGGKE